jgi:hypothetical protein
MFAESRPAGGPEFRGAPLRDRAGTQAGSPDGFEGVFGGIGVVRRPVLGVAVVVEIGPDGLLGEEVGFDLVDVGAVSLQPPPRFRPSSTAVG